VIAVDSAEEAVSLMANTQDFCAAIFDTQLYGNKYAGIELCRKFRESRRFTPIILLSAYIDLDLQELAYKVGADAYVSKQEPLSLLMTRLDALISRFSQPTPLSRDSDVVKSQLSLDLSKGEAKWRQQPLMLNEERMHLLSALVSAAGSVVSINELLAKLHIVVGQNTVVQHIRHIRSEFARLDPQFNAIRTIRGKGYRWVE